MSKRYLSVLIAMGVMSVSPVHGQSHGATPPPAQDRQQHSAQKIPMGQEIRTKSVFTFRDVKISSGEILLEARLYIPTSQGQPLPAAVLNHGSAPSSFFQVSYFSKVCLEAGLAVLAYSKRGCGNSTGVYRPFNVRESEEIFEELAEDGAAALKWLKTQPEIDSSRVGFVGGSQAGWISPLAATKERVDFIVNVAGIPVSAGMEGYHGTLVGDGNDELRQMDVAEADSMLLNFSGHHGYDPRTFLATFDVNTLWILGSRDEVVPVRASLELLKDYQAAGNDHHFIEYLEGVDHSMIYVETGRSYNLAVLLRSWLRDRGIL